MTKQVRVENADAADYKVLVQVWDKGVQDGPCEGECAPDKLVSEQVLPYPGSMSSGLYITHTRYLVVKEAPRNPPSA